MRVIQTLLLAFILSLCVSGIASTVNVSTVNALQTALASAASGDVIIMANGHYRVNNLTVTTSNITLEAQTSGGVFLDGFNNIVLNGNNCTLSGFQFTYDSTIVGNAITVNGNYNTLTQLNFNGYSATHMIIVYGQNNLVSYCNFQNKLAKLVAKGGTGDMVQIIPNDSLPGYNTIRYCSFQHMPGLGGDFGNEGVRIGDGSYSTMISRTVVEYCYFEDTGLGDSEAISVKSRQNILRFNTMNNNPDAMFSFRNGDSNVAYSNFFINSGGIRCKQANNIFCYNNYFQGSGTNQTPGLPGSGTAPIYFEYFGAGYGNNFNVIHNTFYGSTANVIQSPLTNCTWANNIFAKSVDTIFSGTTSGQNFAGNIYQGILGLLITSGMTAEDPQLILNSDNYYGLSASSPAIAAASENYPPLLFIPGIDTLLTDIQGQSRPMARNLKDVGCDQFTTGTITNRPLTLADVGPTYLMSITTSVQQISNAYSVTVFPNPSITTLTVSCNQQNNSNQQNIPIHQNSSIQQIFIYNQLGKEVIETKNTTIDVSRLPAGIYFLKVINNSNQAATKKIAVLKNN